MPFPARTQTTLAEKSDNFGVFFEAFKAHRWVGFIFDWFGVAKSGTGRNLTKF